MKVVKKYITVISYENVLKVLDDLNVCVWEILTLLIDKQSTLDSNLRKYKNCYKHYYIL